MTIELPEDLSQQLETVARQRNTTLEALLRDWLRTYAVEDFSAKQPRTPDLAKGSIWVSDDFDAPLDDAFWLGDE